MKSLPASLSLNEDNLRRTIGLPGAIGITVNQILGGGIVSLTGVAIAMTGGGVPLAYIIAVIAVIICSVPYAALAAAFPAAGGTYKWPARLIHPSVGFLLAWMMVLGRTALSLYGLAAGAYLHAINPWFNPALVAIVLVSIFFLANIAGALVSARLGIVCMVTMLMGFLVFVVFGMAQVDWNIYPEILPEGLVPLLSAAALLSFATAGAFGVAELGREMKNPGRDIPLAMIGGTGLVGILYVLVALPAAGVLPIAEVAGQPLSTVAAEFLPHGLWLFFIIAGAMVALISTMNSEFAWGTKGLLAASDDGWLPKRMGAVSVRFGTPHWLLLAVYLLGIIPALAGVDIAMIGTAASMWVQLMFGVIVVCSLIMRYKLPQLHEASPFKLPLGLHYSIVLVAVLLSAYQGYLLLTGFDARAWIACAIWMGAGIVICVLRYPVVKRTLRERAESLPTDPTTATD